MEKSFNSAEALNKATESVKEKIKAGGEGAIEAHFELNNLAKESENFKDEAKEEMEELYLKKELTHEEIEKRTDTPVEEALVVLPKNYEGKLTQLFNNYKKGEQFTKDDLVFLYTINSLLKEFYNDEGDESEDSRIVNMLKKRNPKEDAPIILGCNPEEIAWSPNEIKENTQVYIGSLFAGVFNKNFKYVLTSFPEGILRRCDLQIGGKTAEEYKKEFEKKNINKTNGAVFCLERMKTSLKTKYVKLIRLKVKDLGFKRGAVMADIYDKAKELGLQFIPMEVGAELRLQYNGQHEMYVATKEKIGNDGKLVLFRLDWDVMRDEPKLWHYDWYKDHEMDPSDEFVFGI